MTPLRDDYYTVFQKLIFGLLEINKLVNKNGKINFLERQKVVLSIAIIYT